MRKKTRNGIGFVLVMLEEKTSTEVRDERTEHSAWSQEKKLIIKLWINCLIGWMDGWSSLHHRYYHSLYSHGMRDRNIWWRVSLSLSEHLGTPKLISVFQHLDSHLCQTIGNTPARISLVHQSTINPVSFKFINIDYGLIQKRKERKMNEFVKSKEN